MSSRRNRGRNQILQKSGSASNPSEVQQSASQSLPPSPEPQVKASRWKWILDHHPAVASYAALVGVGVAIVGLYNQSSQQKDSDRQIEILRESIQQAHAHEIAPRLVVDTIDADEFVSAGEGIGVKLRNVGKGIASNAVARVHLLRFEGKSLEPESVISRRTIAPGDSVPFRFKFPAPPEGMDTARGMIGTIGLYCQDEDGHEVLATQRFTLSFYEDERGRHIVPQFKTPNIRRVNVNSRTSENVRTEHDAGEIVDHLVTQEHDSLREFSQTNDRSRRN